MSFILACCGVRPPFFDVALQAGTDHVFPSALSAEPPGDNMVQGQLGGGEFFAAVLTAVAVAGEEVSAVEFDGLAGQTVIKQQSDNARHSQVKN